MFLELRGDGGGSGCLLGSVCALRCVLGVLICFVCLCGFSDVIRGFESE